MEAHMDIAEAWKQCKSTKNLVGHISSSKWFQTYLFQVGYNNNKILLLSYESDGLLAFSL